jgi:hypothetical protein
MLQNKVIYITQLEIIIFINTLFCWVPFDTFQEKHYYQQYAKNMFLFDSDTSLG